MSRRATGKSLPLPFVATPAPPPPASETRARHPKHPRIVVLPCPGLVADRRPELVQRRWAGCAKLDAAELAWIDEHAGAQAQCPAECRGYEPGKPTELVQIGRSGAMPVGTKAGRTRQPIPKERDGVRMCSRCRKRAARPPKDAAWGSKQRWRWCAECTTENEEARAR